MNSHYLKGHFKFISLTVSSIDVCFKFLDTKVIDSILYQSHLYITQKSSRKKKNHQKEFTVGFLGINTLMGFHRLPSWTYFWSNEPDFNVFFAPTVIPRNSLAEILSRLHVNDNFVMSKGNTDLLYKFHPLINSLNNLYVNLCDSKQFSVHESIIFFKDSSSLKQYNPIKPMKRGCKLWIFFIYLCNSLFTVDFSKVICN